MEGSMPKPKILPAILVVVAAAFVLTAQASFGEPQAQECRTAPGSSTPRGGHWYYRINHKDQQRCWYLSPADAHANGQTVAPLAAAPRKRSAADTAAPAPPQVATAEIGFLQPSSAVLIEQPIASRWPENLPSLQTLNAEDAEQTDSVTPSNSFAETPAETDAAVQMPLRWPIIEGDRADQMSAVESVLRSFSIAGGLLMVILLLAGWAARFIGGRDRRPFADRWGAVAASVSPHRPAVFAGTADGMPAQTPRAAAQGAMPTDPARDLKTSLAELMRDLRRAETASVPVRSPRRRASRSHNGAYRQALQSAQ
jgi:hypothetical protein